MQTQPCMQILLIAPLNTNEYIAPSFLQTHKYIRDYFYLLNQDVQQDAIGEAIDTVVLDSFASKKRQQTEANKLYISSKQHRQLLSTAIRPKTSVVADVTVLMQNLIQEMLLRKVMESCVLYLVTWGEFPLLRKICENLNVRYLSLQFPAPGSQTLNILQINAKAQPDLLVKRRHFSHTPEKAWHETDVDGHLPIFANVIEERWYYSRYNALPACSPESYYQAGKKNVLVLVAPTTDIPDVFAAPQGLRFPPLSRWKTGRIAHQTKYYLRHLAEDGCHIYFLPLSRQAMPLCKHLTRFLRKQHSHWHVQTLQKLSSWPANPIYTLLQKSDAIISVNTTAGIDALRNHIPVIFLGKGSQIWKWLNPNLPLPKHAIQLNELAQKQRHSFRQVKKELVLRYYWFPNHKPSATGFSRWLRFAWEAQHKLQDPINLPTLYFQKPHASLPLKANPFIPLNGAQTSKRQRLKERIQLERRQLRKLRRDPAQYIRDSKTWHFRLMQRFL